MNDILENKIREIGREIYSLMAHEVPPPCLTEKAGMVG